MGTWADRKWLRIAQSKSFETERDMLTFYYHTLGLSCRFIGNLFKVSWRTILNRLRRNNIAVRSRGGANNLKGNTIRVGQVLQIPLDG